MLFDLLPYITLLVLTVVIPKLFDEKVYIFLLFLIFFVFSGFRYGVGWDYFNYIDSVEYGGWMVDRMEFLPRQLMLFCNNHGLTQTFFIVTSFFIVFCCFYMIYKESINYAVSLFVFLCVPLFFLNSMTTVRFSLSVFTMFLAYHFGYKKKYFQYFILLFIAFFIHRAALFGLLTIPFILTELKMNFSTNIVIFALCFFVGVVIGSFSIVNNIFNTLSTFPIFSDIFEEAENYMYDNGNVGFSRTPYVFAVINLINLFSIKNTRTNNEDKRFEHYVTMFNLGCSLTFLFSFHGTLASRLSQPFMVFLLLVVPYYKKNSVQRISLYSIFIFLFFFQLTIKAYNPDFIGRLNCWLPYRMNFSL